MIKSGNLHEKIGNSFLICSEYVCFVLLGVTNSTALKETIISLQYSLRTNRKRQENGTSESIRESNSGGGAVAIYNLQ